ncbi:sensor domain-containing diguanylate cyclase [Mangrovibacillus cuniculi]|uniref:Diguanylate cyclase n=1 Tax=Mangrovibacillus cuniculi TaxID=2593652 RepID=A0A7S8CC36_9BACI|nr:diguanylate cyclase [Mangrovibacillus cuniculi]QPC47068.1 diguanylate cyclase [Mangrovibacillus cuniculi]
MKKEVKAFFWIAWLITLPTVLFYTYQHYPPTIEYGWNLMVFFSLGIIVSMFPITIQGRDFFIIQWLSFGAFLLYDLYIEILVVQASIFGLLLIRRIPRKEAHRYPINSLMFLIVSFLSGLSFYAVGGVTGPQPIQHLIIPTIVYMASNMIVSQLFLLLYAKLSKVQMPVFGRDFLWEAVGSLFFYPFAITTFYLHIAIGPWAIVLLGIPILLAVGLLQIYNTTEKVNDYLQQAVEIGHELTGKLKASEVLDLFIQKVSATLEVDYAYLLDVIDDKEQLEILRQTEKGQLYKTKIEPLKKNQGISGTVWASQKSVLYHQRSDWETLAEGYMPSDIESVICVPIIRNNQVVAVLFLGSIRKRAFEKFQLMTVDILCSYFAVAIENARNHEKTKRESEHCALTGLYNYRYFEKSLSYAFHSVVMKKEQPLSLIMIDLDHFKQVNDSYGHQSGNQILKEVGERLTQMFHHLGTVARFGGEEFVVYLPSFNKKEALEIAEQFREELATTPFKLYTDLSEVRKELSVFVTASIGVATAPFDADDALTLIRHADRALYTGAKQAGRNRVAGYVK